MRLTRLFTASVFVLALATAAHGQRTPNASLVRERVRSYRSANQARIVAELVSLLALPNVASDTAAIRQNADTLLAMLRRRGISARLLEAPGNLPVVFGELKVAGARRTIVLYSHYDGQPVDTTNWATPPWRPTLRDKPIEAGGRVIDFPAGLRAEFADEWRIYARSASDDKAPIVAMLSALDALRAAGIPPTVNIKFFFEGGEEAGSPNLRQLLIQHKSLLAADAWIFSDGPVHQSRKMQVVFGVRGSYGVEMTVYGPSRALHSGHYGNWAANPAAMIASLLASMRDPDGKILVAGFYDDVTPVSDADRRAIASVPNSDAELRNELSLGATEGGGARLAERIMLPALNIRGIRTGHVGDLASNTIHTDARASIDFRLVPAQTPERIRELVEAHVRAQGYHIVRGEPTSEERRSNARVIRLQWEGGYPALRTDMDLPVSRAVISAVEGSIGGPVIRVPILGGSLPMAFFQETLGVPLIIVPIVNHDNNQHAANENLRIRNLWDGIEVMAGVMTGMRF
ncbi:MAG: M20/M25/M40 family metallo-hydrolase [Anaerolineae bacterium]|nr:M20/M25/M40 family metallo-hydrolase [Gemmatimonadaceae bacterium]